MLVLFLLGCGLLCWIYSPVWLRLEQGKKNPAYTIAPSKNGKRAQVVSLSVQDRSHKQLTSTGINFSHQLVDVSPLFYGQNTFKSIPPELALFFNRPVPLNRCQQSDLELLPGIGPHLAALIINERQKNGGISGPEALRHVHGIGPARLQRILPLVSFQE